MPRAGGPEGVKPLTPFVLEAFEPVDGGVEIRVRLTDPAMRRTLAFPLLAEEVLRLLPGIVRHRCESGSTRGVVAELADTEVPHLFEHVTLELLVQAGLPRDMRGETRWDFKRDGRGVYRVFIGCEDEAAVRRTAEGALGLLEGARRAGA